MISVQTTALMLEVADTHVSPDDVDDNQDDYTYRDDFLMRRELSVEFLENDMDVVQNVDNSDGEMYSPWPFSALANHTAALFSMKQYDTCEIVAVKMARLRVLQFVKDFPNFLLVQCHLTNSL
ncbi:uncharacterized protein LOC109804767 isoform X2 [Cajanus cajan]|uniref:uncharacterized protein LOC109804767 isoform X2 n=1 Tax=Cajanus cajan TaxID=3821 RepID=UPI00098D77D8|nr:uncharacterized protein LOC109804767 isoform X2 [Cajanus cajan]